MDTNNTENVVAILDDIGALVNKWHARANTLSMLRSIEASRTAGVFRECSSELQAINSKWRTELDLWYAKPSKE